METRQCAHTCTRTHCMFYPPSLTLLFSAPLSGLHLAVLHSQQEALMSLTQVVAALPGEEVLNRRNHLYQVCSQRTLHSTHSYVIVHRLQQDYI